MNNIKKVLKAKSINTEIRNQVFFSPVTQQFYVYTYYNMVCNDFMEHLIITLIYNCNYNARSLFSI